MGHLTMYKGFVDHGVVSACLNLHQLKRRKNWQATGRECSKLCLESPRARLVRQGKRGVLIQQARCKHNQTLMRKLETRLSQTVPIKNFHKN